jgi:hypothetical protein
VTRGLWLIVLACAAVPLAAQEPPRRTVEFSGLVLVNGFFNNAPVNNSDVPYFVLPDTSPAGAGGGTIRQTRLGVFIRDPNVLRGNFTGEIDADFFGGQEPSAGGRTFPLVRLRRAVGTVAWAHGQLLFGQEVPLVAERNPRSLASVGIPEFAGAGNLWFWLPQVRVTAEAGYTLRLALQLAALAPTESRPQSDSLITRPDSAERSRRPYLQGRVRLAWGPTDDPSELAIGGHLGWLARGDTLLKSQAATVDARIKLGPLELLAEAFTGQALTGLGGGGIGQNLGPLAATVRTRGGWAQLNFKPARAMTLGGGCGVDDPNDDDLRPATGPAQGRLKNFVCMGHIDIRPSGPLVLGLVFRRLKTTYSAGEFTDNHINVAAGFQF